MSTWLRIRTYGLFVAVLCGIIFIWPFSEFPFGDTLAVCLAVLSVVRVIQKLSVVVLMTIVIAVTIIFPIFVLSWITNQSMLSELGHFSPNGLDNLLKLMNLLLPTFVLFVLVILIRSRWWQKKFQFPSNKLGDK